jgi:phosphopantothenoylcysteine decarboxylase/phosphopantothenate--cysteine ligase
MGVALALELASRGAQVTLVLGPTAIQAQHERINTIPVVSAQDMYDAVHDHISKQDIAIFAAAVADYRPAQISSNKIKKSADTLNIELVKNPDILASVGAMPHKPFLVGFALETDNEVDNAFAKAKKKNTDLLVLNSMNDKGAGFKKDTNKISIIKKDGSITNYTTKPKSEVAKDIVDEIIKHT